LRLARGMLVEGRKGGGRGLTMQTSVEVVVVVVVVLGRLVRGNEAE
jgi:hypothetical protein